MRRIELLQDRFELENMINEIKSEIIYKAEKLWNENENIRRSWGLDEFIESELQSQDYLYKELESDLEVL